MKQKTENCPKNWYAHILFKFGNDKVNVTAFQNVLNGVLDVDFTNMNENILVKLLLTLPTVELTFQKYTKVASNITVI